MAAAAAPAVRRGKGGKGEGRGRPPGSAALPHPAPPRRRATLARAPPRDCAKRAPRAGGGRRREITRGAAPLPEKKNGLALSRAR